MFVDKTKVPVTINDEDVIYILPKMPFGVRQRVMGELARIDSDGTQRGTDFHINLGAYNIALMQHNIVGWEGPSFEGVPCTRENIEQLDPDEPLVDKVLQEIGRRNPVNPEKPSPNRDPAAGSTSSKASAQRRVSGTNISTLPTASAGRQSR